MKRRAFFAGLLGASAAAGAQEVGNFVPGRPQDIQIYRVPTNEPKNGQCPLCKTLADPYTREVGPKRVVACMDQFGVSYSLVREGDGNIRPYGSHARVTRCKNPYCNNAFFQDAEDNLK